MDRGFSSSERVQALMKQENQYFVLRIKNNSTINMKEDGTYEVWSDKRKVQVRLVTFSDLETRTEFRFVTKGLAIKYNPSYPRRVGTKKSDISGCDFCNWDAKNDFE